MKDSSLAAIISFKTIVLLFLIIGSKLPCSFAQTVSPDFEILDAGTGKMVNLTKTEATYLVLISYAGNCPFAAGYETRIAELIKQFSSPQIQFMMINPTVSLALKTETK
jgi:hypothetical protein